MRNKIFVSIFAVLLALLSVLTLALPKKDFSPNENRMLATFPQLTAETLAKECALSPDYLCALFKKHVGEPLSVYIRRQRLSAARDLLQTGKGLSEIAYDLGFCSESYFIRCFREEFGETPRRFRERQEPLFESETPPVK